MPSVLRSRPARVVVLSALLVALSALPALADFVADPNMPRDQVPDAFKWNPNDIFADDAAWDAEYASMQSDLARFADLQGRLGESAALLHECLELVQASDLRMMMLESYSSLKLDAEQGDGEAQARAGRIAALWPQYSRAAAFVQPEILALDPALIDRFVAESEDLAVYAYYFEDLGRQRAHTLTPDQERLMALAGPSRGGYRDLFFQLMGVDIDYDEIVDENGEKQTMSLPGYVKYRSSPVYNVRKQAVTTFFAALKSNENILASMLNGHVQGHVMTKEARGYESCLEASLDPDAISTESYKMLIRTINENLPRTLHKFVALKRKVLGLDGPLTFPNLYNSMIADVDVSYTYDEARDLLRRALAPLGREYVGYLNEGLAPGSGWVDIYPNRGKQSGAYSNGSLAGAVHPYIKMNFDDTLDNVSTLAHEFGHSIHSIYSKREQPRVYGGYTTFLAEIASTCNEELLLSYLLERAKDVDTRLMLLNMRMENIRQTIFRQTLFAEFELRFHEHAEAGNGLTADWLNDTYSDLIRTYYGPEFEMGENEETEWAFISQFWRNYYVFAYATGMTSGISMAHQILDKGQDAADRYIDEMLKAGSSAPPLQILKRAGVDLETPRPILDMLDLFEETVAEFDRVWTEANGRAG